MSRREWRAAREKRSWRKSSFDPFYALLLALAALALALLVVSRGLGLFDAPPLAFAATLVLFVVPGAVLAGLFAGEEDDGLRLPVSVPVAFAFSAGLFGILALPFLVLRWSLDAYLLACGGVLALSLAGAVLLALRGRAGGSGSATRGAWLLWVPLAGMTAVLAATAVYVFHPPNGDMWSYLGFVQGFSDVDQPRSAWGRYALNGWVFEQAAMVRITGLEPVPLVQDYLAPVMVVVAVLAFYWLARILFESNAAALLVACVAGVLYLVQLDGLQQMIGSEIVAHSTEDKHVTRFAFLPVALGLAVLYARTRSWRYLALFTFVCWTVVTVHPMGLLLVGISVTGFALVHFALNFHYRRAWWTVGSLGAAMASIGLPPAVYLLATGNPYVSQLDGVDPGMAEFLISVSQRSERLMVLGDGWYIMHPAFLLNPAILAALVVGIPFLLWRVRCNVAAQLMLGAMLFSAALIYFPPISTLMAGFTGPWSLWRLAWPIQLTAFLTLGWMVWELVTLMRSRLADTRAARVAAFLPLLIVAVLMAAAVPSAIAGVRSAAGEKETPQQESDCTDPAFRWIGEEIKTPGTVVLAPDKENSCFPAYSTAVTYVSFRGNQYGEGFELPQNVTDVRKFFEATAFDGEMVEILNRYKVGLVLLPTESPLNVQLRHLPGFEPLDAPGDRYRVYRVDRDKLASGPVTAANGALNDGEYEKAVDGYAVALGGDEEQRFLAQMGLGRAYMELQFPDVATANFEEAVDLAPKEPGAYRALAEAHVAEEDYAEAREALEEAVALTPGDVGLRLDLAGVLQRMEKRREAVEQHREVVERFPEVPEYRAGLGKALNLKKDYDAADREFDRALRLDPRSATLHGTLGLANRTSGRLQKAAGYYEEALDLDPGNDLYTLQLGLTHAELSTLDGRDRDYFESAESELKQAARPDSSLDDDRRKTAYFALGGLYTRWKEPKNAIAAYEKALKIDSDFEPARQKLEKLKARR